MRPENEKVIGCDANRTAGKVLMFSSREICYMSSNFFANRLAAAFEGLGFTADVCELSKEDSLEEKLEPLLGQKYRVIVDFNSRLPRMVMEDGVPYLDKLDGPFFDYLLDHPLFHYNGLTAGAGNMNVLVLDEGHADYVRRYHPQVKSVHMLPLGATRALTAAAPSLGVQGAPGAGWERAGARGTHMLPLGEAGALAADAGVLVAAVTSCGADNAAGGECRVFFPGTYDSPDTVHELVEAAPEPLGEAMEALIERRIAEPLLPMEEAFRQYLGERGMELPAGQFALFMNALYPVDAYVRDYYRKAALDVLLKEHIPVTVAGEGWEKYHYPDERCLRRERPVMFGHSFERIAREQILLNVSPMFNRGMHDRIVAGMANGAVVLTDRNPYLEGQFVDGEEISFYSLDRLGTLAEKAALLAGDAGLRERMRERAYQKFLACHTWEHRARQILSWADEAAAGK